MIFTVASGLSEREMIESFAWVCDRCAEHDMRVALEFVNNPLFSGLPDAPSALRVVQAAGRANGGLMVDAFHHFNGTNDWTELESLPGELIVAIQLDDTPVPWVPDGHTEGTPRQRMVPGEGDADLVRFVRTMDAIGASCAYSVEVISREIVQLPPTELGQRLGNASRRVLDAARA
jgi:sugar phosphate isomerase/epimerase